MIRIKPATLQRYGYFIFSGLSGLTIDVGVLVLLTRLGVSPFISRIPALSLAILATWLINRYCTFKVAAKPGIREALRYLLVSLFGATLNYLFFSILIFTGVRALFALCIASAMVMVINFLGYRNFAFKT